jgi:hypothetical protein
VKLTLRREGENRGWPQYLFWGRMRTSTMALIVAFVAVWWLYATYQPPIPASTEQPAQVVPPGYVPDPEYTWVPRTNVQETTRTTPTTTTTTTTTETTPSDGTTTTTPPDDGLPTTVVDPDGPGPLPPTTISSTPTTTPGQTPTTLPTTPTTTAPGPLNPQR